MPNTAGLPFTTGQDAWLQNLLLPQGLTQPCSQPWTSQQQLLNCSFPLVNGEESASSKTTQSNVSSLIKNGSVLNETIISQATSDKEDLNRAHQSSPSAPGSEGHEWFDSQSDTEIGCNNDTAESIRSSGSPSSMTAAAVLSDHSQSSPADKSGRAGPYPCDKCDKSFGKQSSLARHKYEHSGEYTNGPKNFLHFHSTLFDFSFSQFQGKGHTSVTLVTRHSNTNTT